MLMNALHLYLCVMKMLHATTLLVPTSAFASPDTLGTEKRAEVRPPDAVQSDKNCRQIKRERLSRKYKVRATVNDFVHYVILMTFISI